MCGLCTSEAFCSEALPITKIPTTKTRLRRTLGTVKDGNQTTVPSIQIEPTLNQETDRENDQAINSSSIESHSSTTNSSSSEGS